MLRPREVQIWPRFLPQGLASTVGVLSAFHIGKSEATLEEVDGCDHASDCVDHYWRVIWLIIAVASFFYFILLAWTCWISSSKLYFQSLLYLLCCYC